MARYGVEYVTSTCILIKYSESGSYESVSKSVKIGSRAGTKKSEKKSSRKWA